MRKEKKGMIEVSIPYRCNETGNSFAISPIFAVVSIPYRCNETILGERKMEALEKFQFLIGAMRREQYGELHAAMCGFQFLIGAMRHFTLYCLYWL